MPIQRAIHRPHYLIASGAVQPAGMVRRRARGSLFLKLAAVLGTLWLVIAALDWGLPVF